MDTNGRPKLWYDRGYLPHFDGGQVIQFLTFRLADSLPQNVIERYRLEFEQGSISDREYYREIERYLERGLGPRYLSDPRLRIVWKRPSEDLTALSTNCFRG